MNNQSLLQYLSIALPEIPIQGTAPSRNTTNSDYGAEDITQVVDWPEFNYATIIQRYGGILNSKQIEADPFKSPFAAIRDKPLFNLRFFGMVQPRVRRALRAGFEELAPRLQQLSLVPITFDGGGTAAYVYPHRPDTAFVTLGGTSTDSTNRALGEMEVSWKWCSAHRSSQNTLFEEQYRQVLSKVNFYMGLYNARHGFVLTNTELVAVKRLDKNGRLAVSSSIPWKAGGPGQLTVLMGLWYLGMLAAEETNWAL